MASEEFNPSGRGSVRLRPRGGRPDPMLHEPARPDLVKHGVRCTCLYTDAKSPVGICVKCGRRIGG
jgi:hypothetical protein